MNDYSWLDKKTPRSVEQLKLWPENPRLNPEETHVRMSDFVEDLIGDEADKASFLDLIKSIYTDGFRPFDPIIVWKHENDGLFYVAEGNRRILALKLLLDPDKAPKSIRASIKNYSQRIDKETIKKIMVNVAPNFDEAEWYINQRNNASTLQRTWTRIQQQRWILELYNKYNGDIEVVASKVKMTEGKLENYIRPLKIRDFVYDNEIKKHLTDDEISLATSIKFPITILERFFSNQSAKEKFKLEYNGLDVKYDADKTSFFIAFADLIKKIIYRENIDKDSNDRIDTRTVTTNFDNILNNIPNVLPVNDDEVFDDIPPDENPVDKDPTGHDSPIIPSPAPKPKRPIVKNDPNRKNLVLSIYQIDTNAYRLKGLFNEFKKIPLTYPNSLGVAMRVFLDLSVLNHIQTEQLESAVSAQFNKAFKEVTLKNRLEFLKINSQKLSQGSKNIIGTLLKTDQQFSVDVLNGFTHGSSTAYLSKTFLNRFWDFMFPLFQELIIINEDII